MEALGEYIVNLLNNSIAKWLQDLFLGFITAVMGFVSDMIANMWNIDVIKALVNCTSGISMGVFAVGVLLMLTARRSSGNWYSKKNWAQSAGPKTRKWQTSLTTR